MKYLKAMAHFLFATALCGMAGFGILLTSLTAAHGCQMMEAELGKPTSPLVIVLIVVTLLFSLGGFILIIGDHLKSAAECLEDWYR